MPKKYKKNNKTRRSSVVATRAQLGKKILVGLLAAGVIGGIIATALHYSFANDKRVPSPSTPLPPAASVAPSKRGGTKSGPSFDPSLQLTDLVDGGGLKSLGDITVERFFDGGSVGYEFWFESFDDSDKHADINGNYIYHFDLCYGGLDDLLLLPSPEWNLNIDFDYIGPAGSGSYQLLLYNYTEGRFEAFSPQKNGNGYDFAFYPDSTSVPMDFYMPFSAPEFWITSTKPLGEMRISAGSYGYNNIGDPNQLKEQLFFKDRVINTEIFATNSYSKKSTYPSGIFATGGERELFVELSGSPTLEQIVDQIKVEDYSGATLNVLSSDYDKNIAGDYSIELSATDAAGNISTLTLLVKLRDYQPKLRAKKGNSTIITIGYSRLKNWDMITNLFEASDYNNQSLAVGVKNTDGLKFSKVGLYHPILSAQDKAGRESTITLTINVVDDLPPVFLFSDALCYVSKDKPLNVSQIKAMILLTKGLLDAEVNKINFYENTYSEAANKAGDYSIAYEVIKLSGESIYGTMSMIVRDDAIASGKRSPWVKFCDSITTVWSDFWTKLGNLIRLRGWKL